MITTEFIDSCIANYVEGYTDDFENLIYSVQNVLLDFEHKFFKKKKIKALKKLNTFLIDKKQLLQKSKKGIISQSTFEFNPFETKECFHNRMKKILNFSTKKEKLELKMVDPLFSEDSDLRYVDVSIEAYYIDSSKWQSLIELNKEGPFENDYEYKFSIIDNLCTENLILPRCGCPLCSSTLTTNGNHIDDNCDIWGTEYEYKAKCLYLVYIEDLEKYGLVEGSYFYI